MSRTLKVTGNHVFVLLAVCFVDRAGHRKNSWRQGHTKYKKVDEVAKELFADYVKEKKLSEPEEKRELTQTLKTYILCRSEKERIRWMYNKTITRFVFWYIQNDQGLSKGYQPQPITPTSTLISLDITKTSSNNCLKSWLFSVRLRVCVCLFILSRKRKLAGPGGGFPAFWHATFHHALITCCNIARSGYIWF